MTSFAATNDETLRQTLRTLELKVTRKLDGILFGQHLGLTPGHGSEQGESRHYVPGDDVRRIDWNVTARTREVHVREMIADRDLEAWLGVDVSAAMSFGTAQREKREVALGAAAAVGFLTARNQNRVGAVIAAGPNVKAFPPRNGRDHVRAILSHVGSVASPDAAGATDIGALVRDLGGRARRRGFVCLISDFLRPPATWSQAIGSLAARHDVLAIHVSDPREHQIPAVGTITVADPSTGRWREVNVTRAVAERYNAAAGAQQATIRTELIAAGAHYLSLSTDQDWLGAIVRYVDQRRRTPVRAKAAS